MPMTIPEAQHSHSRLPLGEKDDLGLTLISASDEHYGPAAHR